MTPPHANKTAEAEEMAKRCREECFGPEGPGGDLKEQVDKWRGGLSVGVWVASSILALLAIAVSVLIVAFPRLVRLEISEEFDRRLGKGAAPVATEPAQRTQIAPGSWSAFPVAHAETKGSK